MLNYQRVKTICMEQLHEQSETFELWWFLHSNPNEPLEPQFLHSHLRCSAWGPSRQKESNALHLAMHWWILVCLVPNIQKEEWLVLECSTCLAFCPALLPLNSACSEKHCMSDMQTPLQKAQLKIPMECDEKSGFPQRTGLLQSVLSQSGVHLQLSRLGSLRRKRLWVHPQRAVQCTCIGFWVHTPQWLAGCL